MMLRRGDANDSVKAFQRGLNKLGAMLLIDGEYGKGTAGAVADARQSLATPGSADEADDALQAAVAAVPDPFPPLTAAGVTFIARLEVSDTAAYRRKYQKPCWPGRKSGITIGIGYDCKFVDQAQLRADWSRELQDDALTRLSGVVKQVGSDVLAAQVNTIVVPLESAMRVFVAKTLPEFVANVRRAFPQVDDLPAARKTALVSLVYNRGAGMKDSDPQKQERREMRNIQALLAAGEDEAVAAEFKSMTRLWGPGNDPGVAQRRLDEAQLWESGFAALKLE